MAYIKNLVLHPGWACFFAGHCTACFRELRDCLSLCSGCTLFSNICVFDLISVLMDSDNLHSARKHLGEGGVI